MLTIGKPVPDFILPATGGAPWSLADARGRNVVVYFYPRDDTPGCTREGESFRDLHGAFARAATQVVGVSPDPMASHEKFRARMKFPFPLLSDGEREVCTLFGVWREKSLYGRRFMGVERSTFLIDASGRLQREWRKVRVAGHAAAVLEAARGLAKRCSPH